MSSKNLSPSMSVETARSVVWTFKEFKGQKMGDLIDKGLIGFNNLGYAIERAYDPNVQRASRVLLTHLLLNPDQIKSSNNLAPLNVIKSGWRSFSERRQLQLSMLGGVLVGVLFGIAFAILFTSVVSATNRTSPTPARFESSPLTLGLVLMGSIAIMIAGFAAMEWSLQQVSKQFDRRMKLLRKGQQGEETALNVFNYALNGNWTLFKNLELRGQNGDIDFVLVGSGGVWVIEVKTYSGQYRVIGDQWQYFSFNRWTTVKNNPSRQAKKDATSISHILSLREVKEWVNPAILWANIGNAPLVDNTTVPVWTLDNLLQELNKIATTQKLSPEKVEQIVSIITKAANFKSEEDEQPFTTPLPT